MLNSTELRMLRPGFAARLARRPDLLVRMHVLPRLREGVLDGRCPNCGGELVRRPIRPSDRLLASPGRDAPDI